MPTGDSRCLVIDANVAHAAGGEEATNTTSKHCREFLRTVRATGHRITMTPAIVDEWNGHQSNFSRLWRVQMEQEDRICSPIVTRDEELHSGIEDSAVNEYVRRALRKDMHLVEAALATDKTVASLEKRIRLHFSNAAILLEELRLIVWVNPNIPDEECLLWLENGAEPEPHRQLGFRIEQS